MRLGGFGAHACARAFAQLARETRAAAMIEPQHFPAQGGLAGDIQQGPSRRAARRERAVQRTRCTGFDRRGGHVFRRAWLRGDFQRNQLGAAAQALVVRRKHRLDQTRFAQ